MNLVSAKGSEIFSPWYTDEFIREKQEQKMVALATMESRGEIKSATDWNDKAQRRFARLWDRLSNETKRSYQSAAKQFGKYLGLPRAECKVSNIVARLIILSYLEASTLAEEYVMWMEEDQELSPNTVNVRLAALRWFVDAARRVGWVEWKLDIKNVKSGKVTNTDRPTDAEFRRILRVVNSAEGPGALRDRFFIYMMAFMGVRISSAISLDMKNIDFENKKFKVKWKGEGEGEARYIWRPVGDETFEALEDWLEVRGRESGPVITRIDRGANGKQRLSIRGAQKVVERVGVEAATKRKLTPHAFRHLHVTDSLEAESDTRRVMKSTRHKSDRTLLGHYDDSDDTAAREVSAAMEDRWLGDLGSTVEEDEEEIQDRYSEKPSAAADAADLEDLGVISSTDASENAVEHERISTGMDGVDKLLGGKDDNWGIVRSSIVLLGGYPGIGKSTLARQISCNICKSNPGSKILYASGEESVEQISESLKRLDCEHPNFLLIAEKNVERICLAAEKVGADVLVLDSVSTVAVPDCGKPPGSIAQVKAIGHYFLGWCKGVGDEDGSGIAVIIISHVDKKGNIAGPKALEHHVDAVYAFTSPGKRSALRSLGCEGKNRFGDATGEMCFQMTGKGLVEQVMPEDNDFGEY